MKALFLISIVTLLSLNSFARESFFYDDKPFNRKTANKLSNDSKEDAIFQKIYNAAKEGNCNVDSQLDNKNLMKLKLMGYEITSDEKGGYLITWCD
jgi:hypothetical protein